MVRARLGKVSCAVQAGAGGQDPVGESLGEVATAGPAQRSGEALLGLVEPLQGNQEHVRGGRGLVATRCRGSVGRVHDGAA